MRTHPLLIRGLFVAGLLAVLLLAATIRAGRAESAGASFQSRAIAWTGSSAVIAGVDGGGNLDYWWHPAGGTTWHQEQVAAADGQDSYGSPAIAWTGSSVVIAASNGNGSIDYWWQAAGSPGLAPAAGRHGQPAGLLRRGRARLDRLLGGHHGRDGQR